MEFSGITAKPMGRDRMNGWQGIQRISACRLLREQPGGAGKDAVGVMVVDDSDAVRALWCRIIAGIPGLRLIADCASADAALTTMRKHAPDIVLLDIQLQAGSGMDVLCRIGEMRPATRVIIVSNYADTVYRQRYLTAGAYAFFDKSYQIRELRDLLHSMATPGFARSPRRAGMKCGMPFPALPVGWPTSF